MTPSEPSFRKMGRPKVMDEETEAIINQGASLIQIATLFKMDARDVKRKLHGTPVNPCGERGGYPIYAIKDVAPYLSPPPYDLDEFVQKMTLADLPTMLRKEYWAGMRSRQLYEKEAAELWSTDRVVDTVSTLMKTLRMSLLMSREAVERETELSDRQRAIITAIIDNALEDAHATVTRQFSDSQDSRRPFHAAEPAGQEEL